MLCDRKFLLTGSFNFTYQASSRNCENLIATNDAYHVQKYAEEYDKMWKEFKANTESSTSHQQAAIKLQAIYRGKRDRNVTTQRRTDGASWGQSTPTPPPAAPKFDASSFPSLN